MPDYDAGGFIPGPDDVRVQAHGRCPLDGYHLVETDPVTVWVDGVPVEVEGGWEHVIPASEIPSMGEALRRIAEAHAFEVSAAAEAIARGEDR
jgi:hypothetical protein